MIFALLAVLSILANQNPIIPATCLTKSTCPLGSPIQSLRQYKKGSMNPFNYALNYDTNFFLCEKYYYDCFYMIDEDSYATIGGGIELDFTKQEYVKAGLNQKIAEYLSMYKGIQGRDAQNFIKQAKLQLTSQQISEVTTKIKTKVFNEFKTKYEVGKLSNASVWSKLHTNIKTAVYSAFQDHSFSGSQLFDYAWSLILANDWKRYEVYLQEIYILTKKRLRLLEFYLIRSSTGVCHKQYSINFLIDESGSIGSGHFQNAKNFLIEYFKNTNTPTIDSSVHFYHSVFQFYLGYNQNKDTIINKLANKNYPAGGTMTGGAITQITNLIISNKLIKQKIKILVVLTDGQSGDPVKMPADKARENNITVIAIGVGSAINQNQLLLISGSKTNIIKMADYNELLKLLQSIQNYFCNQYSEVIDKKTAEEIINIKNESIQIKGKSESIESPNFYTLYRNSKEYSKIKIHIEQNVKNKVTRTYQEEVYIKIEQKIIEIFVQKMPLTHVIKLASHTFYQYINLIYINIYQSLLIIQSYSIINTNHYFRTVYNRLVKYYSYIGNIIFKRSSISTSTNSNFNRFVVYASDYDPYPDKYTGYRNIREQGNDIYSIIIQPYISETSGNIKQFFFSLGGNNINYSIKVDHCEECDLNSNSELNFQNFMVFCITWIIIIQLIIIKIFVVNFINSVKFIWVIIWKRSRKQNLIKN